MSQPDTFIASLRRQPRFLGLLAATVALGVAFSFVVPFLSIWATQEIGLSPGQFGLFMTAAALASILVSTTMARWSDTRLARRYCLILGALGGLCGYLGYAWVHSPWLLIAIACSCLALSSTCFPQLFAHVREQIGSRPEHAGHAGLLMSLVRVCFSVAWTAGPALGALVQQHAGFRGLFVAAAGLYLLFFAGILLCVPYAAPAQHSVTKTPIWESLGRRDILAAFLAFVAVFAAHALNMMNLPLLVTQQLQGSTKDLGIIFGVGPLVEIPLMIWFGHLAGLGHQRALIRAGAAVTVLYFALLGLVTQPWQIIPIQILSGISFAILTNVAILFFQDLLPGQAGLGTAIFSNAGNTGNLVGYLSFSFCVAPLGHRGLYALCTGLTLLTLVILLCLRPRKMGPGA